ncbi:LysR family transcriptional regulator [Roseovarius aestuarii]|uniref:HTH-type transcriptional regulator YofA n=1 Tax=Roseovarius aestuarii TaxID=475083 RepID=A0A1X7BRJ3_9RHOB|nr:LysR family transcriptional regulator [Roseovarius aestuarii]SMC12218.1 HTH-type transcriptional regulator YofA [Roseovarius aestuarii]
MNITSLQTFLAIVETGSLVRASEQMNVTQSTVTARLNTLEDHLGTQLLNRQKSGTTLTPAGTKFLRYARAMAGIWRQAKHATALPSGFDSICTFGCDRELWHGPGRGFFNGLMSGQPEMAVSVHQGSGRDLESWLAEGMVDVVLTYESGARSNQTIHPLPPEELVLYSNHPDTPIDADPRYIFVDHGPDYRKLHDETYHNAGVDRISFDSSWWALQCMLDRGGSAYLPRALADPFAARGDIHVLKDGPVFTRKKNLIVNDLVAQNWHWLPALIERLSEPAAAHPADKTDDATAQNGPI